MVLPLIAMVCSPARNDVYTDSNCIVGQAARVQAIADGSDSFDPDSENAALQELQSARAEIRPSANVIE